MRFPGYLPFITLKQIRERLQMIPDNINREHVEKAIAEIDKNGVRKGRQSSTYDLVYKGKTYPPKLVLSIANKFANGAELDSSELWVGKGKEKEAFEFMKKVGFEIVAKNDMIKSLIDEYKKRIIETQLKDEVYKWELLKEYRGRPDPKAHDFLQEVKEVKFKNLIYAMGMAVLHHLAKEKQEELRQLFIDLYDESIDLTDRVESFNKRTLEIYRATGETLQHHQDERSIATYLTFHNPDKYTFYKSSFYKRYCELIGVKAANKNEKYTHYLSLIDDLIVNYIAPDTELIEQVKSLIPEFYDGTNHKLLAQDFLYQMLDKREENNFWIFQGNPNVYDFETALRDESLTDWTVTAHKDKIKIGDKVILWITGNKAGCYALAEVTSEPYPKTPFPDDGLWKVEDKNEIKADIKIIHNLVDDPILNESIEGIEELKEMKIGHQGTNFSATEEEYQTLLDLVSSNNTSKYLDVKSALDPVLLEEFLTILRSYVKEKNLHPEDGRICFSVRPNNNRLIFMIGSRYALTIEKTRNQTKTSFIHKDAITKDSGGFRNKKQEIESYWNNATSFSEYLGQIIEGFELELNRNYKSPFRRFANQEFTQDVFQSETSMDIEINNDPKALNTILYGPPGTGKTYNTVFLAAEIIENRTIQSYDEALRIFKANLHNQIEFITFHQNYSYEDFIQGLRPDTENNNELTFERKDGVFKVIADKALKNEIDSNRPSTIKKTFEEAFNVFINPLLEGEVEELEVQMKKVSYFITAVANKSIEFRKASGGTAHTLSISTLGKMYEAESVLEIQGLSSYYSPLLDMLLEIGKDSSGRKEIVQKKNYVIIIDEINRANISRVFGELITLIEPDKRSGGSIPMEVKLPSGDTFMVPSNMYIIGSMNTADKSIALLDIALRRRFEFEAMYPKYHIDGQEIYDVDILQKINQQIIKSKGHDFQIGHAYFMGENKDLVKRMNKKVIPLLLEYYMNDKNEVEGILKSAGLKIVENSWPLTISGKND